MNISALNPTTPEDWFALSSVVFEDRAACLDRYPPVQARVGMLFSETN